MEGAPSIRHGQGQIAAPRGRAYADGGGAANGIGTFTFGTNGNGGSVTLGTTMAGIGAIVTCGTVGRVTLGMGGRTPLGTMMAGSQDEKLVGAKRFTIF